MSYVVVRMVMPTANSDTAAIEQRAGKELAAIFFKEGCQRFTTVKFADGQIGGTSIYPDKAAAERAIKLANEWGQGAGLAIPRTLHGETVFSYRPNQEPTLANAFGAVRVYASSAAADDVKAALEQEAMPNLKAIAEDLPAPDKPLMITKSCRLDSGRRPSSCSSRIALIVQFC